MQDFVAIDFETANSERSSVCSVGVVVVREGEIVQKHYALIQPEPNYYSFHNTRVHGLSAKDTENAAVFSRVWEDIAPLIGDLPLVAHNSAFDESCLKAVFRVYQMDYPDYPFFDTLKMARKALPKLENHQLHTVAAECGYDLTQHHHALADAEACAWIALQLG